MKRLLAFLLIATIACQVVEETDELDFSQLAQLDQLDDVVLESIFSKIGRGIGKVFRGVGKGVGKFFKGVSKVVRNAVKYLKDHGLWETVINAVKEVGKYAAGAVCTKFGGPLAGTACAHGIDFIADKVLKK